MAQTERKRDFKVLAEKIAPDNILIMAELLAIKEAKPFPVRFPQSPRYPHPAIFGAQSD